MRRRVITAAAGAALLGALGMWMPIAAAADDSQDVPVTVTVEAGNALSLSFVKEQPDPGVQVFDGSAAQAGGSASGWLGRITVSDQREATGGWSLTATVSDFVTSDMANIIDSSTNLVTYGGFWASTYPGVEVNAIETNGSAPRLIASAFSAGPGLFDLDVHSTLSIPAGTEPGDYSSVYTLDVVGF